MTILQEIHEPLTICVGILMGLDILTGTLKAFIEKKFSSSNFRVGLFKKMLEFTVILCGGVMDYVLDVNYIMTACYYLIIGMELYSVLVENIGDYLALPTWLTNIIDTIKNKGESEGKG